MNKKIGDRIKEIRLAKGLQLKYMAIEVDVNDTSYAKMEREGTNSVKTIIKIAEALKVSPSELFVESDNLSKEKKKNYGFATKHDIDELKEMIDTVINGMNSLYEKIETKKKPVSKTHTRAKKK